MDLIGALVHFTSFDAKFQFGNEEETRKDCYYSLGKVASGIHNDVVFAGDNFFFFEISTTLQNILLVDSKPSLVAIFYKIIIVSTSKLFFFTSQQNNFGLHIL